MIKKQRTKNILKKETRGITLIALVVTIIVLLILAGISIMMLAGNNGILTMAGRAKKEMDIATVKEQAEIIKGGAYINKKYDNKELSKKDLLTEIANDKYFEDSIKLNDEVITANDKYKIEVDDNLNITVSEYKNEIEIEYSVENLEYGARITITPKLKNRDTIPTYEEYKTETLNNIQTDDDLKEIYVKFINSNNNYKYEFVYMKAIENINETITWEKIENAIKNTYINYYESELENLKTNNPEDTETIQSIEQAIEQIKQNGITAQMLLGGETIEQAKEKLVNKESWENKAKLESIYEYEYTVTVALNGEKKEQNLGIKNSISYFINKNQTYSINIKNKKNQEGYKIANVTGIENFLNVKKAICFHDFHYNENMYVLTNENKFIKIDNIEQEQNTELYKIGGESNFTVLANNIRDFSCYSIPNAAPNSNLYIINNNNEVFKMDYTDEQENFNTKVDENVLQIEGCASINYYSVIRQSTLYIYSNEPNSIYKDTTKMAENVDQFFYDGFYPYYITKSNELYRILYNSKTQNIETKKIAENVKTIKDSHYLTIDNKLYKDNNEKVKDNVQKIGCGLYITNNNEIYKIPSSTGDNNYNNKVDIEIKELNKDYLITNDDLIYVDYIYNWMY